MRSWVFRNLARLAALRGRPAPAPVQAPTGTAAAEPVASRPRVRELLPVRRRRAGER